MGSDRERAVVDSAWGDTEAEALPWGSGPWSFELRGDELADIAYEGRPVLRAIRAVARDRDWATVPVDVRSRTSAVDRVVLELAMTGLGADLRGRLEARAERNRLTVTFSAVSRTDFLSNRIGLVVLHPPSVAGAQLSVVSPEGARTDGRFPESISPDQPALRIRRLEWTDAGVASSLDFEGDVFEMEDQRNWTDASFKTYSRPLELPFPVRVRTGDEVHQSVTLTATTLAAPARPPASALRVLVDAGHPVPSISIGASTAPDPAPPLDPPVADAVVVEVDLASGNWRAALDRAARDAGPVPLDVRVVSGADNRLASFAETIAPLRVVRVGVYDPLTHVTEPGLWAALSSALSSREPGVELVGGVRSHFTELNRNSGRLPGELGAVTFSVTPQMHARERSQLVESIAMQRQVALDATRIAAGRPVHIGPVTLRPRFNAVATSATSGRGPTDLSAGYGPALIDATDPRQAAPALVAWTVASAAALSVPGVAGLSYFEQWGPRGLVSAEGEPFPVARAVAWLHELSGRPMLGSAPGSDGIWVLGARVGAGAVVLVANLAARTRTVRIAVPGVGEAQLELDALTVVRRELGSARAG